MALIDKVEETESCYHYGYFQNVIREANNPVLDLLAANVAQKMFAAPYDNDRQESQNLRDAIIIPVLRHFGKIGEQHMHPDSMAYYGKAFMSLDSLKDIKNFPHIRGLEVSDQLAVEVAALGAAVDQHLRLQALQRGPEVTPAHRGPSAEFKIS